MNETVLIIDDESAIVELLGRFLKMEGHASDGARTGAEGLSLMKRNLYSLVLCDIRLPDIDGKDLIHMLKEINPLANIVMITGYSSMDNVVWCLGHGAVDYFTKPFRDMDMLMTVIKDLNTKIERWRKTTPIVSR